MGVVRGADREESPPELFVFRIYPLVILVVLLPL